MRVVSGIDQALAHIAQYGSEHTEAIVAQDRAAANRRSLQAEVKEIVEISARQKTHEELRRELEEFSKRFKGRKMADTVELLREDRER